MYQCEATTVEGFVQQLAVGYLARHGYWFYVAGRVPARTRGPRAVDRKLIGRYEVDVSKWAQARRKRAGQARVQYLRHGRFFLPLGHPRPAPLLRRGGVGGPGRPPGADQVPRICGMSYRGGHAHVRIEQGEYNRLKAYFLDVAPAPGPPTTLPAELGRLPFEPYAPVRRQLLAVYRAVNGVRKTAGLELLPRNVFHFHRRVCRPFGSPVSPGLPDGV